MAIVDLSWFDAKLKDLWSVPNDVRPGRYIKRQWKRAGKPAPLREFARTLEPWDPQARAWLLGLPGASPARVASLRPFLPNRPRPARPPRMRDRGRNGYVMIVDDPGYRQSAKRANFGIPNFQQVPRTP